MEFKKLSFQFHTFSNLKLSLIHLKIWMSFTTYILKHMPLLYVRWTEQLSCEYCWQDPAFCQGYDPDPGWNRADPQHWFSWPDDVERGPVLQHLHERRVARLLDHLKRKPSRISVRLDFFWCVQIFFLLKTQVCTESVSRIYRLSPPSVRWRENLDN